MRRIYENFEELADKMTNNNPGILYQINCEFKEDKNYSNGWKEGVRTFAEWLDWLGIKIEVEDSKEDFYWFKSSNYNWQHKYEQTD